MGSLLTECESCGNQSYIIIPPDVFVEKVKCNKCRHPKHHCKIIADKLPPVQEGIEYDFPTMLRLIANVILSGVKTIQMAKIADALWPNIDFHTKRYGKTIWGYKKNETKTRSLSSLV